MSTYIANGVDKAIQMRGSGSIIQHSERISVVDFHQYSVAGWASAIASGKIKGPAHLVHVDQTYHYDFNPYYKGAPSTKQMEKDFEEAVRKNDVKRVIELFNSYINTALPEKYGEEEFFPLALNFEIIEPNILFVPSQFKGVRGEVEAKNKYFKKYSTPTGAKFHGLYDFEIENSIRVTMEPYCIGEVSKRLQDY